MAIILHGSSHSLMLQPNLLLLSHLHWLIYEVMHEICWSSPPFNSLLTANNKMFHLKTIVIFLRIWSVIDNFMLSIPNNCTWLLLLDTLNLSTQKFPYYWNQKEFALLIINTSYRLWSLFRHCITTIYVVVIISILSVIYEIAPLVPHA